MSGPSTKQQKAPAPPSYTGAVTYNGDQLVSQSYMDPKQGVVTRYNPTEAQQQTQTTSQNKINNILSTLGQTSPEEKAQYDAATKAYTDNATTLFNQMYDPMQRDQREDYASRFGGLSNTPYLDAQAQMNQNTKVPALLQIANQATLNGQTMYNNTQNQKIAELQALGVTLNGQQQNFLQNLQNPQAASGQANSFNLQNFMQQQQANYQNQQLALQRQQAGNQATGQLVGAAASALPLLLG